MRLRLCVECGSSVLLKLHKSLLLIIFIFRAFGLNMYSTTDYWRSDKYFAESWWVQYSSPLWLLHLIRELELVIMSKAEFI